MRVHDAPAMESVEGLDVMPQPPQVWEDETTDMMEALGWTLPADASLPPAPEWVKCVCCGDEVCLEPSADRLCDRCERGLALTQCN